MFYLTTHSTHFIYGYMASDIVRKETRCRHISYSFRLTVKKFYMHGLCYTSRGALAGTRNTVDLRSIFVSRPILVVNKFPTPYKTSKLFILSAPLRGERRTIYRHAHCESENRLSGLGSRAMRRCQINKQYYH